MICVCAFVSFPVSAASIQWSAIDVFTSPDVGCLDTIGSTVEPYEGTLYYAVCSGPAVGLIDPSASPAFDVGTYFVSGIAVPSFIQSDSDTVVRAVVVLSVGSDGEMATSFYSYGQEFVVDEDTIIVICQSYNEMPTIETYSPKGIYYQLFDRLAFFIYGEGVDLTGEQTLVLTALCSTLVLICVILPFVACLAICRWCRL